MADARHAMGVMTQTWHDLLFAHWRMDARKLREKVPAAFDLDLFDGRGWLAVVPFHMTNVAPRGVPSLPWVSEFPELNIRTYVRIDDRPGIYFFSLDAGSTLAVRAARTFLNLPYYSATMTVRSKAGAIEYDRPERRRLSCSAVVGGLSTDWPAVSGADGNARILSDGTLLPVQPGSPRSTVPARHSSSAVAAPARRCSVHAQHNGRSCRPVVTENEATASLLAPPGHGRVAAQLFNSFGAEASVLTKHSRKRRTYTATR
jgi:hypothetical protein